MDLFLAICQGIGLALAAGAGGYAALLVAAVLAHVHLGADLRGSDFEWFASAWFIPVLFAATALSTALGRPLGYAPSSEPAEAGRRPRPLEALPALPLLALAAVAFAASLDEQGYAWWPGLVAGLLLAAWAAQTMAPLYATAASREGAGPVTVAAMAGAGAALVALGSVLAPPLALVALAGVAVVWRGRRRRLRSKHAGLRSLR